MLDFLFAMSMTGEEWLMLAGATELIESLENIEMKESTGDLKWVQESGMLQNGLPLLRKFAFRAQLQFSMLQGYAFMEPEGVNVGNRPMAGTRPGNRKPSLEQIVRKHIPDGRRSLGRKPSTEADEIDDGIAANE